MMVIGLKLKGKTMDNLKIEVGKFYKSRNGMKVKIYSTEGNHFNYPIHGAILWDGGWEVEQWTKEGFYLQLEKDCGLDIVSEWVELHPAESWELDKKILVSNDGIDWFKRHFAKYENGQFYVWDIGGTSWTSQDDDCFEWKYAKPAEEE